MTKRECAIVSAHTGVMMLQGDDLKHLYSYLREVTGQSVQTAEIPGILDECHDKIKADFLEVCENAQSIKPGVTMADSTGRAVIPCGYCDEEIHKPWSFCPWCGHEIEWSSGVGGLDK